MLVVTRNSLRQDDTPAWTCSHGNIGKTPLRACSSSEIGKISSLSVEFLLSSDDHGPCDPRDRVAAEPSLCPTKFQELPLPEQLEAQNAPASILHMRAVKELTFSAKMLTFYSIAANHTITVGRYHFWPKRLLAHTTFGAPPPPSKNNIDRVCVKASRAEGLRRLHTNTAYAHLWGLRRPLCEHCRPERSAGSKVVFRF